VFACNDSALESLAAFLQLLEPRGGFERPVDFESISADLFHGIVYAACLALIITGIRTLPVKRTGTIQ
jgi:hypothetical protein